jgi:flagellin
MGAGVMVNTNISSINASRVLAKNRGDLEQAMERLASGKRINSSADDAAGMAVAAKMRAQVASLNVSVRNINDGMSLLQTYDGAAAEVESILVRMRELATQINNQTYTSDDEAYASEEYATLNAEIARIATTTEFNRTAVSAQTFAIKAGSLNTDADEVSLVLGDLDVSGDVDTAISQSTAATELVAIDGALDAISTARAEAGAYVSQLEYALSNSQNQSQRLSAALSGVEDADYATESAALARGMVLAQAGTAMLAQANQAPQYILTLLRG